MRNICLLILLSLCFNIAAQKTPATFWENRCEFKTDGTGKSAGLKIKLSYPCVWAQADGDRPHIVKKFFYNIGEGKSVFQSLAINKMPTDPSKAEIEEMFTQEGLKNISSGVGTFISGRKVNIDGNDCGEVVIKANRETPSATVNIYFMQYYMVYKAKMVVLTFAAGASNEKEARALFTSYKVLFQGLATNTVILSKWE